MLFSVTAQAAMTTNRRPPHRSVRFRKALANATAMLSWNRNLWLLQESALGIEPNVLLFCRQLPTPVGVTLRRRNSRVTFGRQRQTILASSSRHSFLVIACYCTMSPDSIPAAARNGGKCLERPAGIEPAPSHRQCDALP